MKQCLSNQPPTIQPHRRCGVNFAKIKIDVALPRKDSRISSAKINKLLEII